MVEKTIGKVHRQHIMHVFECLDMMDLRLLLLGSLLDSRGLLLLIVLIHLLVVVFQHLHVVRLFQLFYRHCGLLSKIEVKVIL